MEFLGQLDSSEFGSIDPFRWCPLEDLEAQRAFLATPLPGSSIWDSEIERGPMLMFGDAGRLFLFICQEWEGHPLGFVHQCG